VAVTTVAVAIPTIPPRRVLLTRALGSVIRQAAVPANEIHVTVDTLHEGAVPTRNRAWRAATTDWVAFLDDDDELEPWHLEACLGHANLTGADLVYPMFEVVGGTNPFTHFGHPWDPDHPVQTTITILIRRALLEKLDGYREPGDQSDENGHRAGEDFDLVCRANDAGAKIAHLPVPTWKWHHHGMGSPGVPGNTSGLPSRW
jgi:hypothetical protein